MPLWESTRAAVALFATAQHECELLLVGQAYASEPRATREDRLFYSKHIISKSTASGRTDASFLAVQRSCPGLSDPVRLALRAVRQARGASIHRVTGDCYVYRGVGIRGVVASMAVNVTL